MQQAMSSTGGFAILHGASRSSKEVLLTQQSGSTFQAGCQDTWSTPELQDLGALQKLTIGLRDQVTAWCLCATSVAKPVARPECSISTQ